MISSRSLEEACGENITFMALACGQKPDHSTIAAFISSIDKEIEKLFTKVLLICHEEGLLGGTYFSLDGVKLFSNAAKEWSGRFSDLKDKQVSADTGYYSVKNLEACREHEVDAYVPDPQFRKRDVLFADADRHRRSVDKRHERYKSKKRWFSVEDFKMDDRTGKLICPAGHGLYIRNRNFITADGYKAIAYQAPKTTCRDCRLRSKCLRNPDTVSRQVHVFYGKRPGSLTDEMKRKIDTPEGRRIYSKRLGIVESVFGNIKACKRMDRFTLRGRIKVNIQWMLCCLVHNIEKIINFGRSYAMAAG
jgi:IS5 family transposase